MGPSLTAAESGGGCACSFSPPPDDRAPAKRERKMSDEEQQEEGKRFRSLGQDGIDGIMEREREKKEERMAAQAALAARETEWQVGQQHLQQQFDQLMAAIKQSQAAGHGEGGLGLAKGDG